MKCNKYQELVSLFIDSEATPLEQLAVQQHIKSCPKCKGALEAQYELKTMFATVKANRNLNSNISLTSGVMARIKARQSEGEVDRDATTVEITPKEIAQEIVVSQKTSIAQAAGRTFTRAYATAFMLLLTLTVFYLSTSTNTRIVQSSSNNEAAYGAYVYEHIKLDDSRYLINTSK